MASYISPPRSLHHGYLSPASASRLQQLKGLATIYVAPTLNTSSPLLGWPGRVHLQRLQHQPRSKLRLARTRALVSIGCTSTSHSVSDPSLLFRMRRAPCAVRCSPTYSTWRRPRRSSRMSPSSSHPSGQESTCCTRTRARTSFAAAANLAHSPSASSATAHPTVFHIFSLRTPVPATDIVNMNRPLTRLRPAGYRLQLPLLVVSACYEAASMHACAIAAPLFSRLWELVAETEPKLPDAASVDLWIVEASYVEPIQTGLQLVAKPDATLFLSL
ncbi:hypothetical protein PUNSTDRAFT_143808 [Punctularia strigosozonata HHB-11173 SS5]|uniref:uncharacterized protein n=1 Tax=Punctularia strigosozonata (strain HHB-11173) TaxID=741275 RepID=UPI000441779B|nr:uncharacterized protein PUNSTDRAFT_143808 [Punctularia strigosozonata HHB-11173 SS5]EIN09361.1 hypothetical protein PUNSTDRAFT_143808 [Punctularia strigosozonata HHB-11173 SS5]